ncbi:MAG: type III toxin-antitoxin system ToxN/AbiQ family toxin [Treponema sp.]|nr:type III toxin-antitoxin system ToxN/AbiQ family toxin [Treponema sp.]
MFYVISDAYIDYLSKKNPHVMSNKAESRTYHRKYVGILTELNGHKYFVPMSSPKEADYLENGEIKKDSLIKIYMRSEKVLYGTIRFNYMIPVPLSELEEFSVNDEGDLKYKILMQSEYFFIKSNRDKIEKNAVRLYKMRTSYNPAKTGVNKLMEITLDFLGLEKMCDNYQN